MNQHKRVIFKQNLTYNGLKIGIVFVFGENTAESFFE